MPERADEPPFIWLNPESLFVRAMVEEGHPSLGQGSVRYYDREGKPIDLWEWAAKFDDDDYQIVEQTTVADRWLVSTVWLGLDHNFFGDVPLIFETMVFDRQAAGLARYPDLEMQRYSTEELARLGHASMVAAVKVLEDLR